MTSGKIILLSLGVAGLVGVGVIAGPRLMHHEDKAAVATAPETAEAPAPVEPSKAEPGAKARTAMKTAEAKTRTIAPERVPSLPPTKPELQARLKPVLNKGARMDLASEGFKSGEQFAAVAHASRNTNTPFMVLKHRVVDEHKSLASAIRESRPDLNAAREATRAHDAARFDIAAITG